MNQAEQDRWGSAFPKVGIRPTIDGRLGGVRESLEKQTMDQVLHSLATSVADRLRRDGLVP